LEKNKFAKRRKTYNGVPGVPGVPGGSDEPRRELGRFCTEITEVLIFINSGRNQPTAKRVVPTERKEEQKCRRCIGIKKKGACLKKLNMLQERHILKNIYM
jgi:hypothetical protein